MLSNRMKKRLSRVGTTEFIPKNHRKHRRAENRMRISCIINDVPHNPGDKVLDNSKRKTQSFIFTAGGSRQYH